MSTPAQGDRVRILREDSAMYGHEGTVLPPLADMPGRVRVDLGGMVLVERPENLEVLPPPRGAA